MLHPDQFQVDEAWIVFKLNEAPIQTAPGGSINCVCLMDAASLFILGNAFFPSDESEPSKTEVLELFQKAWSHHQVYPDKLFIPVGQFPNLPEEAQRQSIEVVHLPEGQLIPFIKEARVAFKQYMRAPEWPVN